MFYLACLLASAPSFLNDEPVIYLEASGFVEEGGKRRVIRAPDDVEGSHSSRSDPKVVIDVTYRVTATWPDPSHAPRESEFEAVLFCFEHCESITTRSHSLAINGTPLSKRDDYYNNLSLRGSKTVVVATKAPVVGGKASFSFRALSRSAGSPKTGTPSPSGFARPSQVVNPGRITSTLVCVPNRTGDNGSEPPRRRPKHDFWLSEASGKAIQTPPPAYQRYAGKPDLTGEQLIQTLWPTFDPFYIRSRDEIPKTPFDARQGGLSTEQLESLAAFKLGSEWRRKLSVPSAAELAWQQLSSELWYYPLALVGEPSRGPKGTRLPIRSISAETAQRIRTRGYGIMDGRSASPRSLENGEKCSSFLLPGDQEYRQVLVTDTLRHVRGTLRVHLGGRTLLKCKVGVRLWSSSGPNTEVYHLITRFGPHDKDLLKLLERPFPSRMLY